MTEFFNAFVPDADDRRRHSSAGLDIEKYADIFSQAALYSMVQAPVTALAELAGKDAVRNTKFMDEPEALREGTAAWHIQQIGRGVGTMIPCALLMNGATRAVGGNAGFARQLGASAFAGGLYGGLLTPTGDAPGWLLENRLKTAANTAVSFALVHSIATGTRHFTDFASSGNPSLKAALGSRLGAGALSVPVGLLSTEMEAVLHDRQVTSAERLSSMYTFGILGALAPGSKRAKPAVSEVEVAKGPEVKPLRLDLFLDFGTEPPVRHASPHAVAVYNELVAGQVPAHVARYFIEKAPRAVTAEDFQPIKDKAIEFGQLQPEAQVSQLLEMKAEQRRAEEARLANRPAPDSHVPRIAIEAPSIAVDVPLSGIRLPEKNLSPFLLMDIGRALPDSALRVQAIDGAKSWLEINDACFKEFLDVHMEHPETTLGSYRMDRLRAIKYSERMRDSLFSDKHLELRRTLPASHRDLVDTAVANGPCNPHRVFQETSKPPEISGWNSTYPEKPGRILRIGRAPDSDFRVDFNKISRVHAEVRIDPDGRLFFQDLSTNGGIRLNGQPLETKAETPIRPSDKINIFGVDLDLGLSVADAVKYDFSRFTDVLRVPAELVPSAESIVQSNGYAKKHEVRDRLVDGFRMSGRRNPFDEMGVPDVADRAVIVVDAQNDPVLRRFLADAEKELAPMRSQPAKMAEAAASLCKWVLTPTNMPEPVLTRVTQGIWYQHAGEPILLGEFLRRGTGICGEQALLMKVLSDHMGLDCTLVRGRFAGSGGHAWNKIHLKEGNFIVDPRMEVGGFNTLVGDQLWQQSMAGTIRMPRRQ